MAFRPTLRVALVLIPLLTVAFASASHGSDAVPVFSQPVQLPASANFGEPSIAVAPDGTIYVAAPGGATDVWRSDNGGASFDRKSASLGASGDSDIAVDGNGVVYASDLFDNAPVSVSNNKGESYQFKTITIDDGNGIDRQWVAAHGNGNVFATIRQNGAEHLAVSHDGGHTFTKTTAFNGVVWRGNILATSDTDLYIPYFDNGAGDLHLASSHNAGVSWTTKDIVAVPGNPSIFPAVALDASNNVYIAWSEMDTLGGTNTIFLVVSHDGGTTWDSPIQLSQNQYYNVFPWIAADATGHVVVAWLEGSPPGADITPLAGVIVDPSLAAGTSWYVKVAYSSNANTASPTFSQSRVTGVMHTGPICTRGSGCSPLRNPLVASRALLDFFEIAEQPNGNVVIVYTGDTSLLGATGSTALFVIRQTSGPSLK